MSNLDISSLMSILEYVLIDLGTWCHASTNLDLKKVKVRVEAEGLSFLTITLPGFGKDFERSLDQGSVALSAFPGFSRGGGLPRFLGGFLEQIFDRTTGLLLDTPSHLAIWAVRQITLMFAKIALPCSEVRVKRAMRQYVECEQDVQKFDDLLLANPIKEANFKRVAALLWGSVLSTVDREIYDGKIRPRHGPGATADQVRGNAKWEQPYWTERLEEIFPYWEYLTSNFLLSIDKLDHVKVLEPEEELPVRVITVPKTLKTPRVIAIEPTCMQYMQQGILGSLTDALEQDDICSRLINGPDQTLNQDLARLGSLNGDLATLDLSEASDRVSNQHVRLLLSNHPNLLAGVDACRSRKADVPGYGVMPLSKFASMGSALTFPMEAMVFCTIVFMSVERRLNKRLTKRDVESYLGRVRVYGDDIIVPTDIAEIVVEDFEAFGLKVNSSKSFWTGKFRESCGKEFYDGEDVSITRIRCLLPTHRSHASEIVSTVGTRNQFYWAGLWHTASLFDDLLERLNIPFPIVEVTSPIVGRESILGYKSERTHPTLHSPLVKGLVTSSRIPDSHLDDYGALLKCLSSQSELLVTDEWHLERAGRPHTVDTKVRWAQPF